MTHARRLGHDTLCLSCEDMIHADERAYVEHGVGAWHEDCDPPRNLRLYQRERDAKRKSRAPRIMFDDIDFDD